MYDNKQHRILTFAQLHPANIKNESETNYLNNFLHFYFEDVTTNFHSSTVNHLQKPVPLSQSQSNQRRSSIKLVSIQVL